MKATKKTLAGLILIVALVFSISVTVCAAPTIDYTKSGTIAVSMLSPEGKKPIAGVSFKLFYVGKIGDIGNSISFEPTGDFTAAGVTFIGLKASTSKSVAKTLADYANANGIQALTQGTTGADGKLQFNGLQLGLYLMVVHLESGSPYIQPDPFLVGVPVTNAQGTAWEYSVRVLPKIEEEPTTTPETTAPGTTTPGTTTPGTTAPGTTMPATTKPTTTTPGMTAQEANTSELTAQEANEAEITTEKSAVLPQTGQLRWPVPVLSVVGIMLFSLGWADIYLKRKNEHE